MSEESGEEAGDRHMEDRYRRIRGGGVRDSWSWSDFEGDTDDADHNRDRHSRLNRFRRNWKPTGLDQDDRNDSGRRYKKDNAIARVTAMGILKRSAHKEKLR